MTDSADVPKSRRPRKRLHYGAGREALLNAAVHVVARGGLRKLTYRAVAEQAGVTHGLVVHHFGSRDALIEEALAHTIRTSLDTSSLEPGTGRVADFSVGLSEMVTADPDTQAFQYELLLESRRRPELLPQIRELYDEYFDAARRELGRMLPAGADQALTRLVFAALDGLVLHQLVFDEPEVTDRAVEELRTLLRLLHANGDARRDDEADAVGDADAVSDADVVGDALA
ncbi:TetR/AcrR family transcriptional regulator [Streptomyces griseiscabiei]|uniref:TetR family transcriptional regulator n=1 Tax=Streptomyces griseiscabiei TaxID=2993540 RepID=A0ABU4L4K4_9ACTN|nr:TetR family transcriptional regulator [Streptomyces griseiscabiei]MDX2910647.1 TetR family transcriptional regulator [Streptomyces griseiscabiei]